MTTRLRPLDVLFLFFSFLFFSFLFAQCLAAQSAEAHLRLGVNSLSSYTRALLPKVSLVGGYLFG